MNALQIFSNPNFGEIRCVEVDGKPHVVGVDVARSLGYSEPHKAVGTHCHGGITYPVTDRLGRTQETKVIPEGDIYRLIVKAADQSKNEEIKANAERFEKWIFDEVLPSIRKTGKYEAAPMDEVKAKRTEAMLINANVRRANTMIGVAKTFKSILSPESVQLLLAGAAETLMGKPLLPKPTIDIHFSATEIANEIGISSNMVGRVANKNGLKTSEYGVWVLDKSRHSDKQIKSFLYNEQGRQKLMELLDEKQLN